MSSEDKTPPKGSPIYLYCLIKNQDEPAPDLSLAGMGNRGDKVHTVSFLDLAFVVSNCDQVDYETTRANLLCHQNVIEEVMRQGFAPIPVRFNTIASAPNQSWAEERIKKVMRRRFGEFHGLLSDMEAKVELGIKAYWLKERLFGDIAAENREIRLLRDRIASHPSSGLAWRDERIELGTRIKDVIEAKRDIEARKLIQRLRPIADDYRTSKVSFDMMVLNSAFLVHKSKIAEFDARVNELDEEYGDRMKFNYVGPMPPFNFVNIVIHWDEIDAEDAGDGPASKVVGITSRRPEEWVEVRGAPRRLKPKKDKAEREAEGVAPAIVIRGGYQDGEKGINARTDNEERGEVRLLPRSGQRPLRNPVAPIRLWGLSRSGGGSGGGALPALRLLPRPRHSSPSPPQLHRLQRHRRSYGQGADSTVPPLPWERHRPAG